MGRAGGSGGVGVDGVEAEPLAKGVKSTENQRSTEEAITSIATNNGEFRRRNGSSQRSQKRVNTS